MKRSLVQDFLKAKLAQKNSSATQAMEKNGLTHHKPVEIKKQQWEIFVNLKEQTISVELVDIE